MSKQEQVIRDIVLVLRDEAHLIGEDGLHDAVIEELSEMDIADSFNDDTITYIIDEVISELLFSL